MNLPPFHSCREVTVRLSVLLMLCLTGPALFAGAWTPEQGRTYLKLSANVFQSSANYDLNGDRFDPFENLPDQYSNFRDENLSLYFETGLTDRLALFGAVTYKEIEQNTQLASFAVSASNNGFADMDLGLRYRLTDGPHVWSIAFLAKLPYLYDNDDNFFQLGNGQEDYEARVLYGKSLPRGFYMGLEAGYRYRTEEPSDEYRWLAELGCSIGQRFYLRAKYDGIKAVDDLNALNTTGNPILTPRFDLTKIELTAGINLSPRWHLEYLYTETLTGKNTAEGFNNQWALVVTF